MIKSALLLALLGVTGLLAADVLIIDPEAGFDSVVPIVQESPDVVYIDDPVNPPFNLPYQMPPPQDETPYNGPAVMVPEGGQPSVLEPLDEPIDSAIFMPETPVRAPIVLETPTAYYEDPNYNGLAYMEAPDNGVFVLPDPEHLDEVDDGAVITF